MKAALLVVMLIASAVAQAPPSSQQRTIVTAWNECVVSVEKENGYFVELQNSLKFSPPWRVVDAQAPARRAEMIDKIIVEHKRRIELLEKIRSAER